MKGYSRLETAQAAAQRLIDNGRIVRGYTVAVEPRNGWYVLAIVSEPPGANDNIPPDDRSEA